MLDVYPAREEPVGELAGVERPARRPRRRRPDGRAAGCAGRRPSSAPREALEPAPRPRPGPGHDRRRRRLHARRGAGRRTASDGDERAAAGRRARLPAGAADHGPHRRRRPTGSRAPRPRSELVELLAWAEAEGLAIGLVGSGSNLLVADDGFRGLAIKLDGELAAIERDGERLLCGGGARLPSAAAKAAGWGLSGLEFGINIPGTAGGAVKMNANAYGGQLAEVLEWVDVCTAGGTRAPRARSSSASPTAAPTSAPDEVVARASLPARAGGPGGGQGDAGRDARAAPRGAALGDQDLRLDLQEPRGPERAEGRTAGQLLEAAGCRGLRVGGARFSEKHANFVENAGEATTADVLELMAEGRRRVHERFGVVLEPEVQLLGEVRAGRRAGSCEAPDRSAAALVVVGDLRRGATSCSSATTTVEPQPRVAVAADLGDRRGRGRGRGLGRRRRARLAAAAGGRQRCRGCRLPSRPRAAGSAGPVLEQARVLGRRAGAAAPLHREQLLRRKRGGRRAALGDRAALRRRLPGGREVARGGGRARRPVDHRRSIM